MRKTYKNAEIQFNDGKEARVCNSCGYILSYGVEHADVEAYCGACYSSLNKKVNKSIYKKDWRNLVQ